MIYIKIANLANEFTVKLKQLKLIPVLPNINYKRKSLVDIEYGK